MQEQTREEDGEPYVHGTDEVNCPGCGVKQEAEVMAQAFIDNPTTYYVDRECPVCGFNGVWY